MLKLGQEEYCSFWSYVSFITEEKKMTGIKNKLVKIGKKHPKNQ